jgi:branched-subunit amino acid aminotransferase/4-amino-4-deoxychorismate lyase
LDDVEAFVSVESMGKTIARPVWIECARVGSRKNPTVKHGEWLLERKALEAKIKPGCNEIVLVDEAEQVFEGMSSNVCVMDREGVLWTAPTSRILEGTVLKLLLQVCEKEKIPVKRICPSLQLLREGSIMITSTSRLCLPVEGVYFPDSDELVPCAISEQAQHLATRVKAEIENYSVRIL